MKYIYTLMLFALLFSVGCSKTASDNVKTSGFYATYRITGNNQNSATCTATFQVGGPTGTYLDLSSTDSITCDGQSMNRSEFAGIVTYSANVSYVVGKTYNIVLSRAGEGDYISSAVLPEAIIGYSPSGTPSYQKANAINISWTPSNSNEDNMYVYLNYTAGGSSYSYSENDTAPESGVGMGFGATETQVSPPVAGTWNATLKFQRYCNGIMSSGLDGDMRAEQQVTVNVTLTD